MILSYQPMQTQQLTVPASASMDVAVAVHRKAHVHQEVYMHACASGIPDAHLAP